MSEIEISGVKERDIDLLLYEEFYSSPEFREWFVSKIIPHSQICELIRIVRSRTTTNGESDLELSFMDQNTKKITLLNLLVMSNIIRNLKRS